MGASAKYTTKMVNIIKKTIITCLVLTIHVSIMAQVSITATPPAFQFAFKDLWNVQVISANPGNTATYRIIMELQNQKGRVLLAETSEFNLTGGNLILTANTFKQVEPFKFQFFQNSIAHYTNQVSKTLPAGSYVVSYKLIKTNSTGSEPVDDFVFNIDAADLSDLFLTGPLDGEEIQETQPLLTWVYSNPFNAGGCNYELFIHEKQNSQSKWEAVNNNPQVFNKKNLPHTLYQYSVSDRELVVGKTYAWYVKVYCEGIEQAQSEIWQFTIKEPEYVIEENDDPNSYHNLEKGSKTPYIEIQDNYLKVRHITRVVDKDGQLNYTISDGNGKIVVDGKQIPLEVSLGDNRYKIDLCPMEGVGLSKGKYFFRVADDAGEIWKLSFGYKRKKECQ